MRRCQTSAVNLSFDTTSGSSLSVSTYTEGEVYDSSTVEFVSKKESSPVNYNQSGYSYAISTNASREHDRISGLNRKLKNIKP